MFTITETTTWKAEKVSCGDILKDWKKYQYLSFYDPADKTISPFCHGGIHNYDWLACQNKKRMLYVCWGDMSAVKVTAEEVR
jgi:hypothetical protein